MRELEKKRKFKKRLYSLPSLAVLTIIVLLSIKGAYNVWLKKEESLENVRKLQAEANDLNERQKNLEQDIDYLNTPEGIDEEIKERFNVAKTGERVVIIVDPKNNASTTEKTKIPWYKRLWNAIIPGR